MTIRRLIAWVSRQLRGVTLELCDTVGCKHEIELPKGFEDEAYCEDCTELIECAEQGHCGCSDCRHHNVCCWCSADDLEFDYPEYDTTRDRDFDRETDAINDARV